MEEQSFRVLLDFTEINYAMKYVWMCISPRELRNVNDLKQAIARKFPFIQEDFKLFVREGLLLDCEKIAVLREGDTVKLQYGDYSFNDFTTQTSNIENFVGNEASEESISSKKTKKRRHDSLIDHENEINCSKYRKKRKREKSNKSIQSEETEINQESISNNALEMHNRTAKKNKNKQISNNMNQELVLHNLSEIANDNSNKKSKREQSKEFSSQEISKNNLCNCDKTGRNSCGCGKMNKITKFTDDTFSAVSQVENNTKNINYSDSKADTFDIVSKENDSEQEVSHKKRKRKRKRKRKEQVNLEEPRLIENSEPCQNSNVPSADKFSNIMKQGIYDSTEMFITTIKQENPKNSEPSNSKKISSSDSSIEQAKQNSFAKDFKSQSSSSSNKGDNRPKISTPFSKRLQRMESWCITPLMNKLNKQTSCLPSVDANSPNKEAAAKMPYDNYPPLTSMPTVGTHLAYKTLELSENYCPEVTEYKEGIVRNVNPKTEELEIELTQEEIKLAKTGKFEILNEDEVPPPEIVKNVTINWTALIDPKLIS